MDLSSLRSAEGAVHSGNFRHGRGRESGNGKTVGKGHRGQKACSGAPGPGFEGGQIPLCRRLPKGGLKNRNTRDIVAVNVERFEKFENESEVTAESLIALSVISHARDGVKILGNGEFTRELTIEVNAVNEGARAKIEAAGGTCEMPQTCWRVSKRH